ncbi:phage portal protein [Clostridium estertheticum]|uniref:phage portal protein n=1 Tax=Clostridium estertheticum TaxID=238834 RepID=UPI001C6F24FA|nr:phage portal protein [Clostridium estertheticum]MBW9169756.1 phage portal protein [Clostridium estertheticum]WLC74738.1 phage portal protein [Clostridium estertheticum]
MDINEYIEKVYQGRETWFSEEVETAYNMARISNVIENKEYLSGVHSILNKENFKYKEQEFITRKIIINEAKTILDFHSTYLLGKPLSLVGTENMVKVFEKIYRKGNFNEVDFTNTVKMYKYGDSYEYDYKDTDKIIKAKIIDSSEAYPVFSETNDYVCFIQYYCINAISYYTVFYENEVQEWNNEDEALKLTNSYVNLSGLPIHNHNINDIDENFGQSVLDDIKPILNELESLLSKLGDSIYTLSLNPLPVTIGQPIEGSINADMCGASIALDSGSDMKYVVATMDYNTIKLYLDTLGQKLNMVSHMPSIVGSSSIANVSEVSLKMLYELADVMAMLSEKSILKGLNQRFKVFEKLLASDGITFSDDDYVGVSFNYARPQNMTELLDNLTKQFDMGAMSVRTVIEKSPLTGDVQQEIDRIQEEKDAKAKEDKANTDNTNLDANGNVIVDNTNANGNPIDNTKTNTGNGTANTDVVK